MTARAEQMALVVGLVIVLLVACGMVVAGLRGQVVEEADDHHRGPDDGARFPEPAAEAVPVGPLPGDRDALRAHSH